MNAIKDILATIVLFKTENGGRMGPLPEDFFKCLFEFEGEYFDCGIYLDDCGPLSPGMKASVTMVFLRPELIKSNLKDGDSFRLRDGQIFAEGIVDKIF